MLSAIILIPIYKAKLDAIEAFSLARSLSILQEHHIQFIGPEQLDLSYDTENFPGIGFLPYPAENFSSIPGYNRLLLSQAFYTQFLNYEFMLILQTDAIILRDELALWCARPFDYVGAPWPDGVEIRVNAGVFDGANGKITRTYVGNGGLSLRRTRKCLSLLQEFPIFVQIFDSTGSSEDLFFAIMGGLSQDFILPNEVTASHFSMELRPSYYFQINGERLPMGGHAWWKYEIDFWQPLLGEIPPPPYP